ncbi:protein SPT2 homolog [Python bivittatus]|uniref:Protein SPT2 homolog n=1 Tax=Python bivittatus TaxID=176946 RepID=A0A9F2RBT2_PYTBI|nr:protein SPT2 homolog [Python bivittatus]
MDFREILMRASEQQGLSAVPKRYSLAVGPPKKDPKVKGVQSAAVQAFLKRQEEEQKKKVLMEKRRKEELLAKRVELKHDRKARAMASRTKDNFCGYNGIPIEEKPRKRQSHENRSGGSTECRTHDEMNQVAYDQSESEQESEEYEEKPSKFSEKPKVLPKSATPAMNFSDLLKLAEKKQYEPVEIKVVKKTEERPMTAEELRERDYLEKRNRKGVILKEKKSEKEMKHTTASGSSKKEISQRELVNAKFSKHSTDKPPFSKGSIPSQNNNDKKSKGPVLSEKPSKLVSCSKPSHTEKTKSAPKGSFKSSPNNNHIKPAPSGGGKTGSKSHAVVLKTAANGTLRQSSSKEPSLKKNSTHAKSISVASTQQENYKNSSSRQASNNSVTGGPVARSKSSLNTGPGQPSRSLITGHGSHGMGPRRSENSSGQGQQSTSSSTGPRLAGSSLSMGSGRPTTTSGPVCLGSGQSVGPGRPNASINTGLGRGSSSGPGRPGTTSAGTLRPKCTVVSETISSKNLVPRQVNAQMNGMRPFLNQRPGITPQGFPRPSLPPISYKRKWDDEDEDDSEMEDFIDDEGEPQEEISKHIREIFGYDRSKYKDESDYALRYMESSWKEQQKEEARSLRLGMQEDLEELKREEEELKRRKQVKKLRTH